MRFVVILSILLIANITNCQIVDSEVLYNKIILLSDVQDNKVHTGTGFILSAEKQYFLVTAKHVADKLRIESSEIHFRDTNNTAIGFRIKDLSPKNIVASFNENSDFFIMKLEPSDSIESKILKRSSIDFSHLANNRESINRRIDVLVMGYPIFDLEHFSPITFKSYFSSDLINIKIDELSSSALCYLLENPSMEGFSGGPVFVGVKDRATIKFKKTSIVGIVTGTTYDKTGGKFAIITPTFHLLDLLNK